MQHLLFNSSSSSSVIVSDSDDGISVTANTATGTAVSVNVSHNSICASASAQQHLRSSAASLCSSNSVASFSVSDYAASMGSGSKFSGVRSGNPSTTWDLHSWAAFSDMRLAPGAAQASAFDYDGGDNDNDLAHDVERATTITAIKAPP
jgi:hypothetical protein